MGLADELGRLTRAAEEKAQAAADCRDREARDTAVRQQGIERAAHVLVADFIREAGSRTKAVPIVVSGSLKSGYIRWKLGEESGFPLLNGAVVIPTGAHIDRLPLGRTYANCPARWKEGNYSRSVPVFPARTLAEGRPAFLPNSVRKGAGGDGSPGGSGRSDDFFAYIRGDENGEAVVADWVVGYEHSTFSWTYLEDLLVATLRQYEGDCWRYQGSFEEPKGGSHQGTLWVKDYGGIPVRTNSSYKWPPRYMTPVPTPSR